MDGTLLDTERVYFDSLVAALKTHGYTDDTMTLCQAMVGLPGPDCEAMLHARYGENFPLAEISRAFVNNRDEILGAGLPLKRGAVELLDALQATKCPMAIVTSSSLRTADAHLQLAGIRHRFETILTRDDVARGKPRSLSSGGGAVQPEAGGLRRGRGFQPRRDRCPRRRRHHHHGA
jgi:beta-phosphoglucomutase-like phosphatase (HAD superfamily)